MPDARQCLHFMTEFCAEPFALFGVILQHFNDNRFGVYLQIGCEEYDAVAAPAELPFDSVAACHYGTQVRDNRFTRRGPGLGRITGGEERDAGRIVFREEPPDPS